VRTLRIVTAVALASLTLLVADPAAAKGPRSASIDGPGLDAPIVDAQGGMSNLPTLTGLYGVLWSDPAVSLLDDAPTGDLGLAWVITWDMGDIPEPGAESGAPDLVLQTVYPYAEGGPLVRTEAGQPFYDQEPLGGWYEAPSGLADILERLGLPPAAALEPAAGAPAAGDSEPVELAGSTRSSAAPTPDDGPPITLIAVAVGGAFILAAATVVFRHHRSTIG
jgi:hypothetical protein